MHRLPFAITAEVDEANMRNIVTTLGRSPSQHAAPVQVDRLLSELGIPNDANTRVY